MTAFPPEGVPRAGESAWYKRISKDAGAEEVALVVASLSKSGGRATIEACRDLTHYNEEQVRYATRRLIRKGIVESQRGRTLTLELTDDGSSALTEHLQAKRQRMSAALIGLTGRANVTDIWVPAGESNFFYRPGSKTNTKPALREETWMTLCVADEPLTIGEVSDQTGFSGELVRFPHLLAPSPYLVVTTAANGTRTFSLSDEGFEACASHLEDKLGRLELSQIFEEQQD